jgi:nucleoside-diphosphate-sugar epimerase
MKVLLVGCGYVGFPIGLELARQGHEVVGLRRSTAGEAEFRAAGIQLVTADITRPEDLTRLPLPFDWVINCAAPAHGGEAEYRHLYLEGNRNLVNWLSASPPKKYVYTSSTGVYGQDDGGLVKETDATDPPHATGQVLVQAEQFLLQAFKERKFPAILLRLAGIYGPERGHWLREYLKGEAKIPGHGERFVNMIHRDDVVGAVLAALRYGHPGEVYNVVDEEPVTLLHLFHWLADTLGRPMPAFVKPDPVGARQRGVTNKRVFNRKLKMELGYQFKYPTFRDGYTPEIKRLDDAGLLDVSPGGT